MRVQFGRYFPCIGPAIWMKNASLWIPLRQLRENLKEKHIYIHIINILLLPDPLLKRKLGSGKIF